MKHLLASNALLPPLLLLIILLLFQLNPNTLTRAEEGEDVIFKSCSDASVNYTFGSQYELNLGNLLQLLVSNGSRTGFLTTFIGEEPDTVYGLAQCRGDVSMEDCQTCLNAANVEIIKNCPDRRAATIRREYCLLRYATFNFFSTVDDYKTEIYSVKNVTDPVRFNKQLGALMKNLTSIAILEPSKFETGSTVYNEFQNIYGLVECTRDLSTTSCSTCLQAMLNKIPVCCSGKQGGQVIGRSCYVRFEVYKFFGLSLRPPPPSPSPRLPPPPPSPSPSPSLPPSPAEMSPQSNAGIGSPSPSPSLPPSPAEMSPQSNAGTGSPSPSPRLPPPSPSLPPSPSEMSPQSNAGTGSPPSPSPWLPPSLPSLPPSPSEMSPQSNAGTGSPPSPSPSLPPSPSELSPQSNDGKSKSSSSASSPNIVIIVVTIVLATLLKHCRYGDI